MPRIGHSGLVVRCRSRFSFRLQMQLCEASCGYCISAPPSEQQADPATYRPGQQPGEPVPVRPRLAPVGDSRTDAHHFSEDKEPEHMALGAPGSKAGAEPGTEDRDHNEERRACHEG